MGPNKATALVLKLMANNFLKCPFYELFLSV